MPPGTPESTPNSLHGSVAARWLREHKEELIEAYASAARSELEAARSVDRDGLVDNLPELLDNLADALQQGESVANLEESAQLGMKHGQVRARQKAYSLNAVLIEYRLLGRVIFTALRQAGRPELQTEDLIHDALHRGIANSASEFTRLRSEAEREWVAEHERAIQELQATVYDLTERKRLEAELENSRQELHDFFMQAPVALCILSGPEHVYTLANPLFLQTSGRNPVGKKVREAFTEAEAGNFFKILDDVYQTGIPHIGKELPFPRQLENGEITQLYLDIGYHPFRGGDGRIKGILALVHDVTEKVLARQRVEESEAALRQSFVSLQEERELRERFVSTLAHDLRTPLTATKMSSQLLLRSAGDPARLQKLASRISDNVERADQMIRDLLDANRLQAGEKLPLEVDRCCLSEVVRQTLEELSSIHGDRFVLRAPATLEGFWNCSAIRRILENLCGNAVKYGAPHLPITVSLEEEGGKVTLQVHNEGMPIPATELPHLFEPFRRSSAARASGERGWGLGLTLVKGLVEAHGGSVSVSSSEAQGTLFTVVLPYGASRDSTS